MQSCAPDDPISFRAWISEDKLYCRNSGKGMYIYIYTFLEESEHKMQDENS